MKCLVCQGLMEEFKAAIHKIDPLKMVDTGTFRINDKGEQARSIVSNIRFIGTVVIIEGLFTL